MFNKNLLNILPLGENFTKLTGGLSSSINVFRHWPDAVSHIRHSPITIDENICIIDVIARKIRLSVISNI